MISRKELKYFQVLLKILSFLGFAPFRVTDSGEIKDGSRWRGMYYKFLLAISGLHLIFSLIRLPSSLKLGWSGWDLLSKVFHAYELIFEASIPCHLCTFLAAAPYNKVLFNDLVKGLPKEQVKRQRGIVDWIVIFAPFTTIYLMIVACVGILVDVEGKYHYHSVLPPFTPAAISILFFGMEVIAMIMGLAMWGYFAVVQLLFILHCMNVRDKFALADRRMRAGPEVHDDQMVLYGHLRRMQLTVTYFNHTFTIPIYICKILCLGDSTWGTFMFIKCCRSQPLIAALGLFIAMVDGSWYAILYGQAYKGQDGVIEWKRRLRAGAVGQELGEKRLLERSIKSVPDYGLTAGGFQMFHKGTALEFYDFVANNVLTLLISYPHAFSM